MLCYVIQDIQEAVHQDDDLQHLKKYITEGWPTSRNEILQEIRPYQTFMDNLGVIDGILMKGRHIVIPEEL